MAGPGRPRKNPVTTLPEETVTSQVVISKPTAAQKTTASTELAQALVEAINITKPKEKKTISNRAVNTPWTPKDGSAKIKLKRKMYHHGLKLDEKRLSNEEVDLLNKIKPGTYCDGWVKVYRRKDRGLDIDYPVKTASQRLKLITTYGIASFKGMLENLILQGNQPKKAESEEVEY